mgnify:CR=1 FL=1
MRLANGIVIDKEATFGALKFFYLRRRGSAFHAMKTARYQKKSRSVPMT